MNIQRIQQRYDSIKIVPYEAGYLEGTLEVARGIHKHSLYADMPMDEEKLIRQLASSGGIVPERYFKLAVKDGEVLGGFYGCVLKTFFCDALLAKDIGWWIKESARGSAAAVLLLADFEQWAKAQGALKVMIGQAGVEDIDRTRKLYEHCGYSLVGYNTCKEI